MANVAKHECYTIRLHIPDDGSLCIIDDRESTKQNKRKGRKMKRKEKKNVCSLQRIVHTHTRARAHNVMWIFVNGRYSVLVCDVRSILFFCFHWMFTFVYRSIRFLTIFFSFFFISSADSPQFVLCSPFTFFSFLYLSLSMCARVLLSSLSHSPALWLCLSRSMCFFFSVGVSAPFFYLQFRSLFAGMFFH